MDTKKIVKLTEDHVKKALSGEGSGHDWWHICRVWNNAKKIAANEKGADMFIVELASLLHDIADRKFNEGNVEKGVGKVKTFLQSILVDEKTTEAVCEIVKTCSFASSFMEDGSRRMMKTLEGKIVQDADRLDAIGAIGIARTFAYGGHHKREMYNPNSKPMIPTSTRQYTKSESHSINHFYEKLLLLRDLMNTETAKEFAKKRHAFMERFLKEFYEEWGANV